MRQAASDGPAVADLRMGDKGDGFGQEGRRRGHARVVLERSLAGHGAEMEAVGLAADFIQAGDPIEVDEQGRLRDAEVHRRHETLAAGQVLGLRSALPGGVQRLFQGPRDDVVERRRLHRLACLGGGADTSITLATRRGTSAGASV